MTLINLWSQIKRMFILVRVVQSKLGIHMTWGIAAASLLLVFSAFVEDLLEQELGTFDTVVGKFIQSYASERLTDIAIFITGLGSAYIQLALLLIIGCYLLFCLKHPRETVVLFCSLGGAGVLNLVLKSTFQRTRPDIQHLVEAGGYSFPSGHAMTAAAFYGMIGYLLWLNLRERGRSSWYIIVVTAGLITAIGISRIYLGVHFPSDVISGFAAGGVWLSACIVGLHTIRPR